MDLDVKTEPGALLELTARVGVLLDCSGLPAGPVRPPPDAPRGLLKADGNQLITHKRHELDRATLAWDKWLYRHRVRS